MKNQPVNIRPFLYNYLSEHDTYRALSEFLLDLYAGMARAGGMYRRFSWSEIEVIITDFSDGDIRYFEWVLSRLFRDNDVVGLSEIEWLYEFFAVQLLQADLEKTIEEKNKVFMC